MSDMVWGSKCRSKAIMLLFSMLIIGLLNVSAVEARIRRYKWEVNTEYKAPDCFRKLVITINGQTPGPTIRAQQHDTIIVEVTNNLFTENLAIHWHGIRQIGTPWFDGTEGVTQCPVLPGTTFTYQFVVDRPGTYLYHAHYGMQRENGLYGSIIVGLPEGESEPFTYDYDRNIILNDWYHNTTTDQAVGLASVPFRWIGEPQSLLIHGRGRFNCSSLAVPSSDSGLCNTSYSDCSPYRMIVVPGKTYRLRISSMTSLSALSFQIEGHNLTVVEADGHFVEPFVVQNLFIYSGETYSVLVTADQDPTRNYWMTSNIVSRLAPNTPPGQGVFVYYPNHVRRSPPTIPPAAPVWNDTRPRMQQSQAIKARQGYIITPPAVSDRVIVLLNTQNEINGRRRWSVNNVSFTHPKTPYLIALKENLTDAFDQTPPPNGYDDANYDIFVVQPNKNATSSNGIYRLDFNTTVDVILQNANTMNPNNSETHPWHLHGHDFWVLGYGEGKFDKFRDAGKYNLVNPIMKNTVPVHPYGWTALRFRADNPGAWAFHCHIESHFFMGMGVVFAEGIEKVGKLPSSIMGCGQSQGLYRP
ncbi:Cupredoxin superfamily protein [Hibiscus trionum]|uniref:L-ascorbate oxidase n=2 Tax=Hibiscus trionum TaxID=183268 RepID=A0A9W7LKI1_HIBTR|nr:Cupredoxin superfamily protein [Hibiscus trionum]